MNAEQRVARHARLKRALDVLGIDENTEILIIADELGIDMDSDSTYDEIVESIELTAEFHLIGKIEKFYNLDAGKIELVDLRGLKDNPAYNAIEFVPFSEIMEQVIRDW